MEWRVFLTFIAYIRYILLFKYTVLTYIITYSKKKKDYTIFTTTPILISLKDSLQISPHFNNTTINQILKILKMMMTYNLPLKSIFFFFFFASK